MLSLLVGMIKHSKSTQSNQFAISLQYLKKEVRNGIHLFHAYKHQTFYKFALWFVMMEVARHVQGNQNKKLVIFLQHIKKKLLQLLLCSITMESIQIFCGGPVIFDVTCFLKVNYYPSVKSNFHVFIIIIFLAIIL